jgi:hypothetical protein
LRNGLSRIDGVQVLDLGRQGVQNGLLTLNTMAWILRAYKRGSSLLRTELLAFSE